MAQAPPTPPPMSATELRDEARDSIIASSAESSDPTASSNTSSSGSAEPPSQLPAVQDIYQQVFPQLSDLAEQQNFIGITNIAEHHDLNGSNDKSYSRLLLFAPLVLAYMVLDDLTPAQHAFARLPENVSSHPLSHALAALLASALERKYENTYARAQELFQMSQQSDFPDPRLGKPLVCWLMTSLMHSARTLLRLFRERSRASILRKLRNYLGWDERRYLQLRTITTGSSTPPVVYCDPRILLFLLLFLRNLYRHPR